MVIVDLGIPPGFDLLSEDLQDYQNKSAGLKSGRLPKFSLTATQAILYFDSFAPGDTVTVKSACEPSILSARGPSGRASTSTTIPRSAQSHGQCNWR
jgi:hypothetical protein